MTKHEEDQLERHLNFMDEIGLSAQYLYDYSKGGTYPYVIRARPNHSEGILINVDQDIAELQIDDRYNSYWYDKGYERA